MPISYTGLDITAFLVHKAQKMGINAREGSIEKLPFDNSSFQLVYVRHLLELLDYYERALTEAIRVAEKEVMVIFFIPPQLDQPDRINSAT